MRTLRVLVPLAGIALTLVLIAPTTAQGTVDLTGAWNLDMTLVLPDQGGECFYEGDMSLTQTGDDVVGEIMVSLVSGPAECPVDMMFDVTGEVAAGSFSGTLSGGSLGTFELEGPIAPDGDSAEGTLSGESGPFEDSTGSWSATRLQPEQAADLSLTHEATVDPSTPNTTVTLALQVVNAGPDDATGVLVTNELPQCTQFVSDDCDGDSGPPWMWRVSSLTVDDSVSCNLTLDASQCSGELTATAEVTAEQNDPNPADNTETAGFEIVAVPALPALSLALLAVVLALGATWLLRREHMAPPPS